MTIKFEISLAGDRSFFLIGALLPQLNHMAQEIERKFLVIGDRWRQLATGTEYRQGYLQRKNERTVRIRVAGDRGFLTIKGATEGVTRLEYEYPIPKTDALEMLSKLCDHPLIEKNRYRITHEGFTWEVDEFLGENQGLVIAEIELRSPTETFPKPDWIGAEVSGLPRYYNASLVGYPYSQWTPAERQSV